MPGSQEKLEQEDPKETDETTKPKFGTQTIDGLVILFYKNLLMDSSKQYTVAYTICKAMAKRFDEKTKIAEIEALYKNAYIGFPLGVIQRVVYRDTVLGYRMGRTYNYGFSKPVRLGDMIEALDKCMDKFVDIFTEICAKNQIDTTIASPIIEGLAIGDKSGL